MSLQQIYDTARFSFKGLDKIDNDHMKWRVYVPGEISGRCGGCGKTEGTAFLKHIKEDRMLCKSCYVNFFEFAK